MSVPSFGALGVPEALVAHLDRMQIATPSPIQHAVIPDALAGRDVAGRAPTGSGKTLAFGLPVIARLAPATRRRPTALVLAPTRELAQQIADVMRPLARAVRHDVAAVYGGTGYAPQRKALDAGVEVLVACPGRLEDLLSMGAVDLREVRQVVIDEADRMADMGFLPAVRRLVAQTNADRQVLLFSATFDGAVGKMSAEIQRDPSQHEVGPAGPDVTAAQHVFWRVEREARAELIAKATEAIGSTMVFCRTRHGADRLAKQLGRVGVESSVIHGGRTQPQRDRALKAFAGGEISVLVATDVAARGVHVDDVAAVVHFDPPADAATYVHRSGRTARAGASGVVVSFVEQGNLKLARSLQRTIGIEAPVTEPKISELRRPTAKTSTVTAVAPIAAAAPIAAVAPSHLHGTTRTGAKHTAARRTGTVSFFHPRRGFGFIASASQADLFVHHANTAAKLSQGLRVEYSVREGRRGLEAVDVVVV